MASVGEQLHSAREAQHLTINQIAEITNVRGDHIRAIEEGNYDVFSAPVYIKGFVRTYARILKLDVPQVMAALEAELGRTDKFSEPPPLTDQPRTVVDFLTLQLSKIDWRKAAMLAGVLVVGIIVLIVVLFWQRQRNADPLSGLKPAVYQPASNHSGDRLAVPAPAPRR